jgi:hypothetical protein
VYPYRLHKLCAYEDFVYCFTIKPESEESCLNPESSSNDDIVAASISTCENMYIDLDGSYHKFKG